MDEVCIEHVFIEDLIDINPDRSQYIIYCQRCHYIPKNKPLLGSGTSRCTNSICTSGVTPTGGEK